MPLEPGASGSGIAPSATAFADVHGAISGILAAQHGAARRKQLREAGLSTARLNNLLRSGRLQRRHCCVYCLGEGEPSHWTRAAAAALAASVDSGWVNARGGICVAVSHRMAALLHAYLTDAEAVDHPVDVSGRPIRRVRGVRVHRTHLGDGEAVMLNGIPVTSPARTILDLAGVATSRELEQALAAGERADRMLRPRITHLLEAHPRHRGSGQLRRLLAALAASGTAPLFLRSKAEEEAARLICRIGAPPPLANHRVAGIEVDFLWPSLRFILEVDGFEFHRDSRAFHRDHERDRTLAQAGYQVLRLTWRQLTTDAVGSAAALAATIARLDERERQRS